ncbi:MAG: acetyl-CoA carboxylase biotin carboxylase subunit [Acidiferrobacterales bacterium]|nr:acetyl-CoA carboxylase biotin carboxylase subunit [Acidiferrobacterales bacterium]
MKRLLIANRGEIALRVVQACRNLGIQSVAVYTDADRKSLHVLQADDSIRIGPNTASHSYLNHNGLIHAAVATDCQAIHPGYGFLSENSQFARLCEREGLIFIGPHPDSIERMGDKSQARAEAVKLNIEVVPGSQSSFKDAHQALRIAKDIDFPVLIKARGGGGGRGMRIVRDAELFVSEFTQAAAEAQSAFGDGELYLEKYLTGIRHVEVQILADNDGNVIALGERDCTIQRRHQKLVEESPCSVIDDSMREGLHDCAVRLGKSIGYRGAGTVEFVLTEDRKRYYFIEMNTRIQVEHPVTEQLFGLDLVEAQIRIAGGESLSSIAPHVQYRGHAIEFRINAENWQNDFIPSPGVITHWKSPATTGVRVDTHAYESFRISPYYDSMIAKLIIHGHDREHALARAEQALEEFQIAGVATTIGFHQKLLRHTDFKTGNISTKWVEDKFLPEHT